VAKVDVAIIGAGAAGAARAALTVVEDYLGRRLAGFEDSWRY